MNNQQVAPDNKQKKLIRLIVILGAIAVVIIGGIIYFATKEEKSPAEEYFEDKSEIIEKQKNMSEGEKEDQAARIATIESIISQVMSEKNNNGVSYLKDSFVDRRVTEREEYFAQVEFNADEYEWTRDISLDERDIKEYKAIMLKCAELYKALHENDNKVYYSNCKAFQSDDVWNPVFTVLMQEEEIEQVDWSQSAATLATDILPSIWKVGTNDYWIYDKKL